MQYCAHSYEGYISNIYGRNELSNLFAFQQIYRNSENGKMEVFKKNLLNHCVYKAYRG